jgi:thiamine-monophosphate kinase
MSQTSPEFSLIDHYFRNLTATRADVPEGIGNDCAILSVPAGCELAVSIDTLVEGVHFFADVPPQSLGHKALAVGLSDLAAVGATPSWFTLALTLPEIDSDWLAAFSAGLGELAKQHNIQLVGGDTTRGPLSISIQVHGFVPAGQAISRSTAKPGDVIYVSGTLGDAGAALKIALQQLDASVLSNNDHVDLLNRLQQPTPRNAIGQKLLGLASAAIDVSDGLAADLGHILQQSQLGAELNVDALPLSPALQKFDSHTAQTLALFSGDDYELCFTVPASKTSQVEDLFGYAVTAIGMLVEGEGIRVEHPQTGWQLLESTRAGYDHFS